MTIRIGSPSILVLLFAFVGMSAGLLLMLTFWKQEVATDPLESSGNQVFYATQMEREALVLLHHAHRFVEDPSRQNREELQVRFGILWGRLDSVKQGPHGVVYRSLEEAPALLAELQTLLRNHDPLETVAETRSLIADLEPAVVQMNALTIASLQRQAELRSDKEDSLLALYRDSRFLMLGVFGCGVLMAGLFMYKQKALSDAQQELSRRIAVQTEELARSKDSLRGIFDNAPVQLHLKDGKGRYAQVNKRTERMFGVSSQEVQGRFPDAIYDATTAAHARQHDLDVIDTREVIARERHMTLPDGEGRCFHIIKFPIMDSEENLVGLGSVATDVSDIKMAQNGLIRAKEEAEMANRAKSDFLANMSHEIRTPLNAIIGFSEVIRDEVFGAMNNPRYQNYAEDIYRSGRHLLDLIGDILDLSKIEAGRYEIEDEPVPMDRVVRSCINIVDGVAQDKNVGLHSVIPEGMTLCGDERALKQILLNLLSNAVKFTPDGGSVHVDFVSRDGGLVATVRDTGVGIAEADIERVMEPFTQVGSPTVRRQTGSGIGLAISKRLAGLMEMDLTIQSRLGEGTSVMLHIPSSRVIETGVLPVAGKTPPKEDGGASEGREKIAG